MVKVETHTKTKNKKLLQLKKLSQNVPQSKFQQYQEEEINLFDNNEEVKQENQLPKEEEDINDNKIQYEQLWEDEHDEQIQIDLSKIARLRKLITNGQTIVNGKEYQQKLRQYYKNKQQEDSFLSWAKQKQEIKQEQQQQSLKQLLTQNIDSKPRQSNLLQSKIIQIEQAGIIKSQINTVIQSISFHNKLPIFVAAGFDKILRIYQFNQNKQIQLVKSIGLEKFPICKAQFMNNSNEIIAASPFKTYLLIIDINQQTFKKIRSTLYAKHFNQSGKFNRQIEFQLRQDDKYLALFNESGYIHIINGQTKILINEFKQNESCKAVTFVEDDYLISAGQSGKIYQWSLSKQQIFNVFHNPGGFEVNCLDYKIDLLSVGCKTGIVNIFKLNKSTQQFNSTPIKEIQNLTTSIDQTIFNHFGEILVISSKWKQNALKLIHVDSLTVFENWPNFNTCLKKISAIGISTDSRFLVIGNEDGELRAFRLLHY